MTDENKVADVLSRMLLLGEDLADAKTKEQKAMWAIDAKLAMDGAFELINELLVERDEARSEVAQLNERNEAMGRYVSFGKRQKSQYFRAVKWFLAHTNFDPKDIPTTVRLTLEHVTKTLIRNAQRAAEEVKS